MISAKIKKWGNSFGLRIAKNDMMELGLTEDQDVLVDIVKKDSSLRLLFGAGKGRKITKEEFERNRKSLESTRF